VTCHNALSQNKVLHLAMRQISSHCLSVVLKLTIIRSAGIPHCINWFPWDES
jgi:hypothetical protein